LLDFKKAFDTVNHPMLIHKLAEHYRIRSVANKLLSSFLSNRQQYIALQTLRLCCFSFILLVYVTP